MDRQRRIMIILACLAAFGLSACSDSASDSDETCTAGATQCADNTVQICGQDGVWSDQTDCAAQNKICRAGENGAACADNAPDPEKCEAGSLKCDENGQNVLVCNAQGEYIVAEACGESEECKIVDNTARCAEKSSTPDPDPKPAAECEDGETTCNGDVVRSCGEDGKWIDGTNCAAAEDDNKICEIRSGAASCVAECTDGATKCSGLEVLTCADGAYAATQTCDADTEVCKFADGAATCAEKSSTPDPEPTDKECEADQTTCNGDVVRSCGEDGKWIDGTNCAAAEDDNKICEIREGKASCVSECTAGATKCSGLEVLTCADGAYSATKTCNADAEVCKFADGAATCAEKSSTPDPEPAAECEADQTTCNGDVVRSCGEDGKWIDGTNCAAAEDGNKICEIRSGAASCVSECTDGATKCSGLEVLTCADGAYAATKTCDADTEVCKFADGAATCAEKSSTPDPDPTDKECETGQTKCDGTIVVSCNAQYEWQNGEDCSAREGDDKNCVVADGAAACSAVCAEGYAYCKDGKVYVCDAEGIFQETQTCDEATQMCKDSGSGLASCQAKPAEPVPCPEDMVSSCETGGILRYCGDDGYVAVKTCAELGENYICRTVAGAGECFQAQCTPGTTACENYGRYVVRCENGEKVSVSCKEIHPDANNFRCYEYNGISDCREVDTTNQDSDGDTIPDVIEGRLLNIDTDGDTVPDYLDWDSDGDTIPDSVEGAGDDDGDGIPNFRDPDSDGNGIPDSFEGCRNPDLAFSNNAWPKPDKKNDAHKCANPIDTDNDGTPDYLDFDNDGDGIADVIEIRGQSLDSHKNADTFSGNCKGGNAVGSASAPVDCDGDTVPDYMSADSDGDGLPDRLEGMLFYGDVYARYSTDADGDTIPDAVEGKPIKDGKLPDSDGDGIPDILELDSDDDGLADAWEEAHKSEGYDRTKYDTDGDGVSDLIEYGAGTKPNDPSDNPQSRGNFVFVTPYKKPSSDPQTLSFETGIQTVDMFFNIDSSTTMNDEIKSLRTSLKTLLSSLQCNDYGASCTDNNDCSAYANSICSTKGKCIQNPSYGDGCLNDMRTGLGWYSSSSCFRSVVPISDNVDATVAELANSPADRWGFREPPYQMPVCAIMGNNAYNGVKYCNTDECYCDPMSINNCIPRQKGPNCVSGDPDKVGCVGYRKDAIKLYLQAFDEEECRNNTNSKLCLTTTNDNGKITGNIMAEYKVRWIGLYSQGNTSTGNITAMKAVSDNIGKASGTVDSSGNPFSYNTIGKNFAEEVKNGIMSIVRNMPIQITTEKADIDANASKLVDKLVLNKTGAAVQGRTCTNIANTESPTGPLPGIKDLLPGTSVCYDVYPVQNQSIFPATTEPQVKKARIYVKGDGSVLNSGIAYFLIPPVIEGPNM